MTLPSITKGAVSTTMQYDPGASDVALSHADCRSMGLDLRRQCFAPHVDALVTGEWAAQLALPLMGVGRIRVHDVQTLIWRRDCGVSLLGQSALEKFSAIVQQGGVITFRR